MAICGNLLAFSRGAQPPEDKCLYNTTPLPQTAPRSRRDCETMPRPDCGFPRQKEADLQNPGIVNVIAIITAKQLLQTLWRGEINISRAKTYGVVLGSSLP